ncbi:MAG TPA: formate dehydrogenase subunit gamma [Gammaproteobacteria bacterium]|nr:formate dehydrogenase subunit gamma [Acidiferrobacteraceae bacterium]MDP6399282.1 formate dehydrogenase subunit gamma [Arenicellales bacterium]HCX88268.1 formate dehydrogenase subunit gamma [Gammaproteobacteria bacterium]MDP6551209.1 formate dehydrogenase subunit gamma [Arenicellales bacterium]MDP6790849.1 formate dehydrogenase subunit gamma [Arenicellales bacterium]
MTNFRSWAPILWFLALPVLGLAPLGPVLAQSEEAPAAINNPNPGADLWRAVRGHLDSPAVTQVGGHDNAVLVNQEGERWMSIRNQKLIPQGGDLLIMVLLIIGAVYAVRGPVTLRSGAAGVQVQRHSVSARVIHWFLAGLFIILGLTGLVLLFGKSLLIPLIGKSAFGVTASASKELHNLLGLLFPLAIVLIFFNLVRNNLYEKGDLMWFLKGGGMIGKTHASAGMFNGGEKMLFWLTIILGIGVSVTGYILDFPAIASWIVSVSPDFSQYRHVMEFSHVIHTVIAILFIALVFGHIFLAVFFVPGTLSSMTSGKVDASWAEEHHDRWYAEIEGDGTKES